MDNADVRQRLAEEVKLRAYDDRYIDKDKEREILQLAIQKGLDVEAGRAALAEACDREGYVLESAVLSRLRDVLETFAENDGWIDRKEFADALTVARKATQGKRNDNQLKKMVIQLMEDNSWKAKQWFFHRWYDILRREMNA